MARPQIEAVQDAQLPEFADFLHRHLNATMSPAEWQRQLRIGWSAGRPNYGFALRDNGALVGAIGAFYADRHIDGRDEKVCNITSWCVLESHRQQSMRLAMAVLAQPGWHFTDFSPTKVVAETLKFLKFQPLEDGQYVVPNLPWPATGRVLHRDADIRAALQGDALKVYQDHREFPWLRHALVGAGGRWCHVVYKRRVFKGLPTAFVLHVSDPALFGRHWRRLSAWWLFHGFASFQVERRVMPARPWPAALRTGFNPKLYRSDTLQPAQVDYLYSETMALDL